MRAPVCPALSHGGRGLCPGGPCPCVCQGPSLSVPASAADSGPLRSRVSLGVLQFQGAATRMGAATRQDFSLEAMLTLSWLALACFPGAVSTGEPPRRVGARCLSGRRGCWGQEKELQGRGGAAGLWRGPANLPSWASVVSHKTMGLDQTQASMHRVPGSQTQAGQEGTVVTWQVQAPRGGHLLLTPSQLLSMWKWGPIVGAH